MGRDISDGDSLTGSRRRRFCRSRQVARGRIGGESHLERAMGPGAGDLDRQSWTIIVWCRRFEMMQHMLSAIGRHRARR